MLVDVTQAFSLLPHGPGMRLIDTIVQIDDVQILCETRSHLRKDNPLLMAGCLPNMAYIEYAAQAAGLHLGLMLSRAKSDSVPLTPVAGYIGGLKEVHFFSCEPDHSILTVKAQMLVRDEKNAIYFFQIYSNELILAEGRISLVQG